MIAPLFHEVDGHDYPLGALDLVLVRGVLRAAAKMRRRSGYQIHIHVKRTSVVVHVLDHVETIELPPD